MIPDNLENCFKQAVEHALKYRHEYVTLEHLLSTLIELDEVIELFYEYAIDPLLIRADLSEFILNELSILATNNIQEPRPSIGFQRVIQKAILTANSDVGNNRDINGIDILLQFYDEKESFSVYFLESNGLTKYDVKDYIHSKLLAKNSHPFISSHKVIKKVKLVKGEDGPPSFLGKGADVPDDASPLGFKASSELNTKEQNSAKPKGKKSYSKPEYLEKYAVNMNMLAEDGDLDTLVGRTTEVNRTIEILSRRTKNNPIFIGNPGVGKTAIIEGLARRIVFDDDIPNSLKDSVIYSLDMGLLIAGTKYRGDFEERINNILEDIEKHPESILFIDEIHTIIGAGSTTNGAIDASNLLKPALARGRLKCIGATTFDEYKKIFEQDKALNRRFCTIEVKEPSVQETIEILEGIKHYYEEHHNVEYSHESIELAASLSDRFITSRKLPDKAIDVIDEAGARKVIRIGNSNSQKQDDSVIKITGSDIKHAVSKICNIPVTSISVDSKSILQKLERDLKSEIFGQNQAIENICESLKLSLAGLKNKNKPIGSFLFVGQTGVGKTELAKQFADKMMLDLIRIDMSEYMERHALAKLVGSPPGYVGYEEGGTLTYAVTKRPHSVVLLDEIEKAHPDVLNLLLQILDYGKATDSKGEEVDFTNTIIIMTSNAGAKKVAEFNIGFAKNDAIESKDKTEKAVKELLTPELLARIDEIVQFNPLSKDIAKKVVGKILSDLDKRLKEKDIKLMIDKKCREYLFNIAFQKDRGARGTERIVTQKIKQPLAQEILFGKLKKGGNVKILFTEDKDIQLEF